VLIWKRQVTERSLVYHEIQKQWTQSSNWQINNFENLNMKRMTKLSTLLTHFM